MAVSVRPPLSRRETQVAELAAEGRSTIEIANLLFVSRDTVKTHLRNVFRKCEVRNRIQLAAWWYISAPATTISSTTNHRRGRDTSRAHPWELRVPGLILAAIILVMVVIPLAPRSSHATAVTPDVAGWINVSQTYSSDGVCEQMGSFTGTIGSSVCVPTIGP